MQAAPKHSSRSTSCSSVALLWFTRTSLPIDPASVRDVMRVCVSETSLVCCFVAGVFPKSDAHVTMSCLMVSRKETTCRTFSGDSQLSLDKSSLCMDPLHDLLWRCAPLFSSFLSSLHCLHIATTFLSPQFFTKRVAHHCTQCTKSRHA